METQTPGWSFETEPADDQQPTVEESRDVPPAPAPERSRQVVVRRRSLLFLGLAAAYAVMAALFLTRAITGGSVLDSVLAVVLVVGTLGLWMFFFDSREDLLVADDRGIRLRLGGTWRGMFWVDMEQVTVLERHGLHDGRLLLQPIDPDEQDGLLGRAERVHARLNTAMYGAPFAMPLTLTTRVVGADDDLVETLVRLAEERCPVVRVDPYQDEVVDESEPGPDDGEDTGELPTAAADGDEDGERQEDEPALAALEVASPSPAPSPAPSPPSPVPSPTPWPVREPGRAVRADVSRGRTDADDATSDPEETQPFDLHEVLAREDAGEPGDLGVTGDTGDAGVWRASTVVIDDVADLPVVDPVIGPVLATARRMLHLDVDQLAERTRIRPHVIEAMEIDDFAPCGGDFYARGHLRTLARVLGVEVAPLLATYDERYADAPIDPLRVFEAELAGGPGGSIRGTRNGPNWSVLVAAVMTVVLAWSVARLVMDPGDDQPRTPSLADGSAGLTSSQTKAAPVPVTLTAAGGGAHLVVRDGTGKVVFTGDLAFGQSKSLQVPPPVRVQSTDGSTRISVQGHDEGPLGRTGRPSEHVYTAP